jgi:hypothetical protein
LDQRRLQHAQDVALPLHGRGPLLVNGVSRLDPTQLIEAPRDRFGRE